MPGPETICVPSLATETTLAWLAMALTPGLGPRRIQRAVRGMREPAELFRLPLTALEALQIPVASARFIAEGKARKAAEEEWQRICDSGCGVMTLADADYPVRLREIFDPPPVLWVRGDRELLSRPSIAVVGTRAPSPYGIGMAEMLSRDLAARRMVILSGMARGVDTAAHRGALKAGGGTAAVWGTGLDVVYPKENKGLAEEIIQSGGAIVSEQPMGTFPAPQNFPLRNRILSGMSVGVLVVEAGEQSGTRITARCALEQNRDVYAVPGNVTNKGSWGPNTLIKQGARLTATWEDVWEELPTQIRLELEGVGGGQEELFPASGEGITASLPRQDRPGLPGGPVLSPPESAVYEVLRMDEALHLEELLERLEGQVTSAEVFTALFELELNNHIRQLPGKNYLRRM
ncbi:MAG TPA: DNA-processing protein DprA [Acidobacteriaceae bacterium]|nr:DNA-processing protein DprA [Acidobacteriaceae bacterium]